MAEWFAEGLLERLTDQHDTISLRTLAKAVFYVVPNMNPDGSHRGHQRTNAAGANLNREWQNPRLDYAPEVSRPAVSRWSGSQQSGCVLQHH